MPHELTSRRLAAAARGATAPALGALQIVLATVVSVLTLSLVLAGCGGGDDGAAGDRSPADQRLLVVTSVPIIYTLAANVAGDSVRLENILPPGASPHQVSFTPAQARLVADADLVLVNGAGLEPWVDDLVAASGNTEVRVVAVTKGVEFLQPGEPIPLPSAGPDNGDDHGGTPEGDHDDAPDGVDPHVWLDVANARLMVGVIADELAKVDPQGAADYRTRAAAYDARLAELDLEIGAALSDLPNRHFVSFHSAFLYYARAYGLEQAAVIAESPGKEPPPQYLAALVEKVRELGVRAVFSEPQFSPRAAEALAREAGIEVFEVDPEGSSLSPAMYEELMRDNTATFVRALGGTAGG
ncbi:MAG: metal ABC transporter substrate-binding protein [Actinobacteria bacterium]|nr:metal ABC transporter substrate-binding protein [Actinomycetota bacterium]